MGADKSETKLPKIVTAMNLSAKRPARLIVRGGASQKVTSDPQAGRVCLRLCV